MCLSVQSNSGPSDTQLCHRFINFETQDAPGQCDDSVAYIPPEKADHLVQEFVQQLKQLEGKQCIVYSKTSCEVSDHAGREWTVCVIFDSKKCQHVDPSLIRKPLFSSYG